MTPQEIIDHTREELRRWLLSDGNGVSEHEAEEYADRMLVRELARKLSMALCCADIASRFGMLSEDAERQIFNWE